MSDSHNHATCRDWLGQLSEYIDGELEAVLCAALEEHLADCPNCQIMVDTVRKTITLYHAQAPGELPSDVKDRLFKVLKLDE